MSKKQNRYSVEEIEARLKTDDNLCFDTSLSFAKVVNNEKEFIAFISRFFNGDECFLEKCSAIRSLEYFDDEDEDEDEQEVEVEVLTYNEYFDKPFAIYKRKVCRNDLDRYSLDKERQDFVFPSIAKITFDSGFDRVGDISIESWVLIPLTILEGGTVVL
jgi:hypothetical protein